MKVEGSQASFSDSLLFENHGTVTVGPNSTLTIEGRIDAVEEGQIARSQAGLANVANGILLGGTWRVDGKLDMVGVSLSKIGSDAPTTSSGTGSEGGQVINQPVAADSLISGGQPAQVTLSGTAASFPALSGLVDLEGRQIIKGWGAIRSSSRESLDAETVPYFAKPSSRFAR